MMKKIAFVLHAMDLGGAQRVASSLSIELAKNNDVTIIVFEDCEEIYPHGGKLLSLNFKFHKGGGIFKITNVIRQAIVLRKVFKEHTFDKIYSFMEGANYPSILADKRTIASIHCNPDKLYTKRDWLFSRLVYPRAHKIIAVSDTIAKNIRKKLHLNNVICVYNPIDFDHIEKEAKKAIPIEEEYIIAIGRLAKEKNFKLLIDAFAGSKAKENCSLVIIGEGELRTELEERIQHHNMVDRIKLIGFHKNPFKYLSKAELLVVSSNTEAFPMSIIEALSLNIPVVSTDCPTGPGEIIKQGENGLLTETGNTKQLTEAIDELYFNTELRKRIQSKARDSVKKLAVANIAEQILGL